jgi:hypothetical protein
MRNALTEKELRQTYRERTCECGSYISKDHGCFNGHKEGLSFVQWIADMSIKYPQLGWMRNK